ncbi:uncharacterized protein LOC119685044 [Teleopsis dalmanni]|uniref:uncharacterized protein LOC119685044 n=1 Tax=Teleopsis dalmanni TaxID=139649 RepID=UPI000D32BDFF|nr:uncharacterized protein LOC119685044 [Teleopsis dalmanni]
MDQKNDVHYVRCLKCLKILKCSRFDTVCLLEHIRKDHPEIQVVSNSGHGQSIDKDYPQSNKLSVTKSLPENARSPDRNPEGGMQSCTRPLTPQGQSNQEALLHPDRRMSDPGKASPRNDQATFNDDTNVIYQRRNDNCQRNPNKKFMYRTSMEKWRPGKGNIYCPKCGTNKPPLIKTRTERTSNNTIGAACLFSCWPFCCLPYCCPGNNKEYLHCSNCKNFLGLYDPDHNCIRPNRDYAEAMNIES